MAIWNTTSSTKKWESATQGVKYTVVTVGAADTGVVLATTLANAPIGVLTNDPKQNEAAYIVHAGICKVLYGGTIAAGKVVGVSTPGSVVALTADQTTANSVGIAIVDGSSGHVGEVLINPRIVPDNF